MSALHHFAERFEENYIPEPNSGCWLWTRSVRKGNNGGRAVFKYKGQSLTAARLVYRQYCGDIPAGMHVCHKCDIPLCVNPDHLWLGTHLENMRDMARKGRAGFGPRSGRGAPVRSWGGARRGMSNPRAKLTDENVISILRSQDTANNLAARFGVSKRTVRGIRDGRSWAHISAKQGVSR